MQLVIVTDKLDYDNIISFKMQRIKREEDNSNSLNCTVKVLEEGENLSVGIGKKKNK